MTRQEKKKKQSTLSGNTYKSDKCSLLLNIKAIYYLKFMLLQCNLESFVLDAVQGCVWVCFWELDFEKKKKVISSW